MKTRIASFLLVLALTLGVGCSSVTDSSQSSTSLDATSNQTKNTNALQAKRNPNPAWTFISQEIVQNTARQTVSVSDVDATNYAIVYRASTSSPQLLVPTWSASGGSVSFIEMPAYNSSGNSWSSIANWGNYAIKAVDVSVANNGTINATNTRTIFSASTSDSMRIVSQAWCPATSGAGAGKIAFMVLGPSQSKICLVSVNGGSATTIYTVNRTDYIPRGTSLTWSPDGTKLAFALQSGTNTADSDVTFAIKVIDLSGNTVSTLLSGTKNIGGCRWSNTGVNKIAYWSSNVSYTTATASDCNLYTINADGSSSPSLVVSACQSSPAWSPNNAELAAGYSGSNGSGMYRVNLSTLNSSFVRSVISVIDWK